MTMVPIASEVITGSGLVAFNFSNIPQTYTHLEIRSFARVSFASGLYSPYFYFNLDFGTNYSQHYMIGDGSSPSSSFSANAVGIPLPNCSGASAESSTYGASIVTIMDYTNTGKHKATRGIGGADLNGSGQIMQNSGLWRSTAAINQIQISTGNASVQFVAGSRFDLYGIMG